MKDFSLTLKDNAQKFQILYVRHPQCYHQFYLLKIRYSVLEIAFGTM